MGEAQFVTLTQKVQNVMGFLPHVWILRAKFDLPNKSSIIDKLAKPHPKRPLYTTNPINASRAIHSFSATEQ